MPDTLVQPAHLWVPPSASTAGPEAADLAASAGLILDGEQRLALNAMLAEDDYGRWAAPEFGLVCARQNMKTVTFQAAALADLFLHGDRLIVWTAHLFRTTQEAFRDLNELIDGADHLRKRVKKVSTANGDESIELLSGARIIFLARSKTGGRGLSGDKVFLDEAFALVAAMMGSLLPTMSARPNPQVRYGSSAGMLSSEVLRAVRDRGRRRDDPSLGYVEWCAPEGSCVEPGCEHRLETSGCALDDVKMWRLANPALGRRIPIRAVASERRSLTPLEFARERMGWWEDPAEGVDGMPVEVWNSRRDVDAGRLTPVAFSVTVAPDRSWTTIGAAGRRADGRAQLEVPAEGPGVDWAVDWLADRVARWDPCAVVLDGTAKPLLPALQDAGIEPVLTTTGERVAAATGLYDGVTEGRVAHTGDPLLAQSVAAVQKRKIGDGWVWDGPQASPLQAVSLALYGLVAHGAVRPPPPAPRAVPATNDYRSVATAGF